MELHSLSALSAILSHTLVNERKYSKEVVFRCILDFYPQTQAHTHTHTHTHTWSTNVAKYKARCVEPKARGDTDDPTHDKRDVIWYQCTTHSAHYSHQMTGQNHWLPANPVWKEAKFIL